MKLVSEVGRFALKNNSMIFGNVIWLCEENDKKMYHLIEKNSLTEIDNNMNNYLRKE